MIPVETTPGIRGGRCRRIVEGVYSYMIYLIHLRTCVNITMYQGKDLKRSGFQYTKRRSLYSRRSTNADN
jgi:hypothetical protein